MSKLTYISTRNQQEPIDFFQAILQGIGDDGGLLVPNFEFKKVDLESLSKLDYEHLASTILNCFVDKEGHQAIEDACHQAYGKDLFDKGIVPVAKAGDYYVAELFHGPTAAFKDMALTILPYFMTLSLKQKNEDRQVLILTATSGDTGKAALEGFKNVENTAIKVFYPQDGVSPIQKQQMVTQTGNNVDVIGIEGNFDDAQTAVKKAFNNAHLKEVCEQNNVFLSSANSINIGRLLPQVVYYFYTYFQLVETGDIALGDEINFCIPSGNFGNCLAGYFAKQMGLPVKKFICASNKNNILTDFFTTGKYDTNREFYKTNAPAMDILVSSNLERLVWFLSDRDGDQVAKYMQQLNETGVYEVSEEIFKKVQEQFAAGYTTEEEVLESIKEMYTTNHYLMDTHTATGYHVLKEYREKTGDETKTILLSTASAYKFPESVYYAITDEMKNEYEAIDCLYDLTKINVPAPLLNMQDRPVLHTRTIEKDAIIDDIENSLVK